MSSDFRCNDLKHNEIHFFTEGVKKPNVSYLQLRRWLRQVIANYGKKCGAINYIFCSDDYLLSINQEYLQHDSYTDIITFDYCEGEYISGDIFVSTERVADNARKLHSESSEIYRVIVHGILHLCGLSDSTAKQTTIMRAAEDEALKLIK